MKKIRFFFDYPKSWAILARMEITKTIRDALTAAVNAAGGQSAFFRKSGICQQSLSRYLSGDVSSISNKSWKALYPHIYEYLDTIPLPTDYHVKIAVMANAMTEAAVESQDELDHRKQILNYAQYELRKMVRLCAETLEISELDELLKYIQKKFPHAYAKAQFSGGILKGESPQ